MLTQAPLCRPAVGVLGWGGGSVVRVKCADVVCAVWTVHIHGPERARLINCPRVFSRGLHRPEFILWSSGVTTGASRGRIYTLAQRCDHGGFPGQNLYSGPAV